MQSVTGNEYTFRGSNSVKIVYLPSKKVFTLKGNNFLQKGQKREQRKWLSLTLFSKHYMFLKHYVLKTLYVEEKKKQQTNCGTGTTDNRHYRYSRLSCHYGWWCNIMSWSVSTCEAHHIKHIWKWKETEFYLQVITVVVQKFHISKFLTKWHMQIIEWIRSSLIRVYTVCHFYEVFQETTA